MVFNAVFYRITLTSRRPVHLSMLSWSSFNLYSILYNRLLSHIIIVETMDSGERGMNPVAMTIINLRKEYWPSRGSNQRLSVLKFCKQPTELSGLGITRIENVFPFLFRVGRGDDRINQCCCFQFYVGTNVVSFSILLL